MIDHWCQTETGWATAANPLGIERLPVIPGSPAVPMPGYEIDIADEAGHPVCPATLGPIVIRLPLPHDTLPTLRNADAWYRKSCPEAFSGDCETVGWGMKDERGYLSVFRRNEDLIEGAGRRF